MAVYRVEGEWRTGGRELVPVSDPEAHFADFVRVLQQTEHTILGFAYDPRAERLQRAAIQIEEVMTDVMARENLDTLAEKLEWLVDDTDDDAEVPFGYAAGQDLPLRTREVFALSSEGVPLKVTYHEPSTESPAVFSMQAHDRPMITWLKGASEGSHFYFSDNNGTVTRDFSVACETANALPAATIVSDMQYEELAIACIPQQRSARAVEVDSTATVGYLGSATLRKLT